MKRINRVGAYGILLQKGNVALVTKIKGPYEGLLDLPGGEIEFGESSSEALKREIQEELALKVFDLTIYDSYSYLGILKKDTPVEFHHLGIIYKINQFSSIEGAISEDVWNWYTVAKLSDVSLTPFAQRALESFRIDESC